LSSAFITSTMRNFILIFLQLFFSHLVFSQRFIVSYSETVFDKPFSGKVLLYLSKDHHEPMKAAIGFEQFPCLAIDVKNVQPGKAVLFDDNAISYPAILSDMERNEYYVQAVWDRNLGGRAISESAGNIYSKPIKVKFTKDTKKIFSIQCDQVIPEKVFKDTKFIKELKVQSALLSAFYHKPFSVAGVVALPAIYYEQPQKKFPLVVTVNGWGTDYHDVSGDSTSRARLDSIPAIIVLLDGNCPLGHSVYTNSDNNGPWGDALVKEFIPELEKQYRCDGTRFVRGHSSGGWAALWLQTHYPSFFTACLASSPDPVDFRDFHKVNLYEGENMFYTKDSSLRPLALVSGLPWTFQKQGWQMEHVIYRGEQKRSYDAVFSRRGVDGNPESICDPLTGEINKKVLEHWKSYDISLYVRSNWDKLQKDLQGKIRVSVGEQDNFFLNSAVHVFENEMKKLNTGFVFAYYHGDHFTVFTNEYKNAGSYFLIEKYLQWQKENEVK
jgi:hypothetical protein